MLSLKDPEKPDHTKIREGRMGNMKHAVMPVTAVQRNHARFGALQTRQNRLCQNKNLNNKR